MKVSDDVWREFRAAVADESISVCLGELVEREVERYRAQRLREGSADDAELLDALARARELREELAMLVVRLERRLDGRQH